MVDVTNLNNYKSLTRDQLEWFILFGICVAGKGAKQTEAKVNSFLGQDDLQYSPFELVRMMIADGNLGFYLRKHRLGQYTRIEKAFREVIGLDLYDINVEMLEKVPGIGPKTARMIMLYYDPQADCVPLDTHILKYLKAMAVPNVPKSTPQSGKRYNELEAAFQKQAQYLGVSVRELDTQVWKSYARI